MTTQFDASVGIKKETTYGTAVVVDRHFEFNDVSLAWTPEFVQGMGLRVGSRVPRLVRRSMGKVTAGGGLSLDAFSKGLGVLFEAAFGSSTSTMVPTSTAYQQVHTPATSDALPSYTIQVGTPPIGGGTTTATTYTGCMCDSIEFSVGQGGIVGIATDWKAKDASNAPAYAVPTYPAGGQLFTFVDGTIVLGGTVTAPTATALAIGGTTVANITDWSCKWSNNLDDGGFTFGSAGRRSRKNVMGRAEDTISGTMTAEYTDNVLRDAFINQTALAMLMTFKGSTAIDGTNFPTLQVYVPAIRLNGETPKASTGNSIITQSIPYIGLDDGVSSAPIYVVYVTDDTAI